jgi:hypothetical protein
MHATTIAPAHGIAIRLWIAAIIVSMIATSFLSCFSTGLVTALVSETSLCPVSLRDQSRDVARQLWIEPHDAITANGEVC